jgi:hypothetical protein
VSATDRIAKLEAILARVTERAKAPRGVHVASLPTVESTPGPASVEMEVEVEEIRQVSEPPVSIDVSTDEEMQSSERIVAAESLAEIDGPSVSAEVEIAAEAYADTAGELEPLHAPEPEAPPAEPEAPPAEPEAPPGPEPELASSAAPAERMPEPESAHEPEPASEAEPLPQAPDVGEQEPPASSRRPIAVESKLEDLAFGDATAPEAPHTPPPESGRQVASPPVDLDFDGDSTGIRSKEQDDAEVTVIGTPPPPPPPLAAPVEAAVAEPAPPMASDVVVSAPEVTRAILPDAPVAVFEGSAPVFKPASFGELLEATLAL